jgi:hypothetical protein
MHVSFCSASLATFVLLACGTHNLPARCLATKTPNHALCPAIGRHGPIFQVLSYPKLTYTFAQATGRKASGTTEFQSFIARI